MYVRRRNENKRSRLVILQFCERLLEAGDVVAALFEQRVQIMESEVRTVEDRVFDRFRLVEFDGTPISSARRLEIQVAVLSAIEPARRSVLPPS